MLYRFTVENYKNFNHPISIDFSATHDYKYNYECIKNGLINKAIIYGANSSGKSNLGFALFDIVSVLTDKHLDSFQHDEGTFLNADSDMNEASFTYVFKNNKDYITYQYRKSSPAVLTYEQLTINDSVVFTYDFIKKASNFTNMEMINAANLNFEYYENNLPVLRYIAYNTIQPEGSCIKFIINYVSHMLWFRSLNNNSYIGFTNGIDVLDSWIANNNLTKDFQNFIKKIANLNLEIGSVMTQQGQILVEKHKNRFFNFNVVASNGSKALELLFYWSRNFKDVSLLFIDEFDAYYHFELSRNVIRYLLTFDNMQALVTTHNSYLASSELLRPDCYFMLENGKLASFADNTKRELREGHNLEKLLRNGEFNE